MGIHFEMLSITVLDVNWSVLCGCEARLFNLFHIGVVSMRQSRDILCGRSKYHRCNAVGNHVGAGIDPGRPRSLAEASQVRSVQRGEARRSGRLHVERR